MSVRNFARGQDTISFGPQVVLVVVLVLVLDFHHGQAKRGFLVGPGRQLKERALQLGGAAATLLEQLCDLGEKRIAEMDAAGVLLANT